MTLIYIAAFIAGLVIGLLASLAARQHQKNKAREAEATRTDLPAYERLARAFERDAERWITLGGPKHAEGLFSDAARVRKEATEAMLEGLDPMLREDDAGYPPSWSAFKSALDRSKPPSVIPLKRVKVPRH